MKKASPNGAAGMKEPRKPPRESRAEAEKNLDEALKASFPASDPPANTTPTSAGGPARATRPASDKPPRHG
jgi:hypothetical protein